MNCAGDRKIFSAFVPKVCNAVVINASVVAQRNLNVPKHQTFLVCPIEARNRAISINLGNGLLSRSIENEFINLTDRIVNEGGLNGSFISRLCNINYAYIN